MAVAMLATCICCVNFTALSDDEYTYEYTYEPDCPSSQAAAMTGPSFIKLYWEMPYYGNAEGVEVLSYNSTTKQYKLIKDMPYKAGQMSYKVADLKKDTYYIFAVRSYVTIDGVRKYSNYAKIPCRTSPAETSLTSVKYVGAGKMKINWKKVDGVSGYIIKYSTSANIGDNATTCTLAVSGANNTSRTISGLAKKKYYVKICTYKTTSYRKFMSAYSTPKTVTIKEGVSMKTMLNSIKTGVSGRDNILYYTDKGVDIAKYSTTYDRFKAIYNWHSKHNTDYGWSCVGCNSNFNRCLAELFKDSNKTYDYYIYLAAGNVRNNDGSVVMHKWSVIYLAGTPYIFDPRLQGYTGNKTGNDYFGILRGSVRSKMYLFDYWYGSWASSANEYNRKDYLVPTEAKPATVTIKKLTAVKGGFKLDWNKVGSGKGYQIFYSTNSKFTNAKSVYVNDLSTTSKTVTGLKSGATYYVKIRAYKQYGNTKHFGISSAVKSVKIK